MANNRLDSLTDRITNNLFALFVVGYGSFIWLPFLAPVMMRFGWVRPANAIYFVYSFFCHQLPERSYFLFGQKFSYSLAEIQAVWVDTANPILLRKFVGTAQMGWKVAWSDRMISFYGGIWLFGLLWWLVRRRTRGLAWWGLVVFLLPMALDGGTHFISDLAGIGQGFRDTNIWLATLTNSILPASFYAGDMLGTFNSWMRLVTGLLAGLGTVWFGFPRLKDVWPTTLER